MKWMRSLVPTGLFALGVASTTAAGIAIAAQNQDDAPPTKAKPTPTDNQKVATPSATDATPAPTDSPRAALGAKFEVQGDQGLTATTVDQKGVLFQAGLKPKDRIITADGHEFHSPRQLEAYLWGQSGRLIPVVIERGGQRSTIQAHIPHHGHNSGWLGVFLDEGDTKTPGARVAQIYPSGPAARAGLHVGDLIQKIDDEKITNSAEAVMLIREFAPQTTVQFAVTRGTEELNIPVKVGSRREFPGHAFRGGPQPGTEQPAANQFGADDAHQMHNIPPYAMQLENDRRNAEQHERIEDEIRLLRAEIQKLRELIEKK